MITMFTGHSTLMMAAVETRGGRFEAGVSRPLFDLQLPTDPARNRIVGDGNGRRLLVNMALSGSAQGSMTVLLNWRALLKH